MAELVADNDPAVRDAAANAVFWCGWESPVLATAFVKRFNSGSRDDLTLGCLAAQGGPEASAALRQCLDDPSSPALRSRALHAIVARMRRNIGDMSGAADRFYTLWQDSATSRDAFHCLLRLGDRRILGEAENILKQHRHDWTDSQKSDIAEELAKKAYGESRTTALRWLLDHRSAPDCGALCQSALDRLRQDPATKSVLATLE
jgi:HEAT repeat protein